MDLDTAQRLSLIQRNLQAAQLAIDTATELLNIVIGSIQVEHTHTATVHPAYQTAAFQPAALPTLPQIAVAPAAKARSIKEPLDYRVLIEEYLKAEKPADGSFTVGQIAEWLKRTQRRKLNPKEKKALGSALSRHRKASPRSTMRGGRTGISEAIREFAAHNTGSFTLTDLFEWSQKHGYPFTRKQLTGNIGQMALSANPPLVRVGDGRYQAA